MIKPETRVLVSKCMGEYCIALILRGKGIDGALASRNGCQGLCMQASRYLGELRYSEGDCSCGLPMYPGVHKSIQEFLERLLREVESLLTGIRN